MRILTLVNTPLDIRSGSGYVVTNYAEGLRQRGHRVDLLGPRDYEPFFGASRAIRYRQAAGMLWAALRLTAAREYDVLELYGGEAWLASSLLTRLPGRRFIVVAHSNGLETHCAALLGRARQAGVLPRRRFYHVDLSRAEAIGFGAVDGLVTVSAFDAAYAQARAYAKGRVLAIENPLPSEYLGLPLEPDRESVIGFVGTWLPRKGVDRIVAEVPSVLREYPGWRLTLVGVGDSFRAGDHFPADIVPRIEVIPSADRLGLLKSLYSRLAIVIMPSLYESFGLVAAEAMACGAALVATRVGFAWSLDDGREAVLMREQAGAGLADALRRLMADDTLRRRVAAAGHARVQSLTWKAAVDTLESAYADWLSAFSGGRGGAS